MDRAVVVLQAAEAKHEDDGTDADDGGAKALTTDEEARASEAAIAAITAVVTFII